MAQGRFYSEYSFRDWYSGSDFNMVLKRSIGASFYPDSTEGLQPVRVQPSVVKCLFRMGKGHFPLN